MVRQKFVLASAVLSSLAVPAFAKAAETTDKSAFTLFNAVPEGQMRELSPDRPDKTESPISVDAGHFQLEASIVSVEREAMSVVEATNVTLMELNAKAGLTANTDLQIVLVPVTMSSVSVGGIEASESTTLPEAQVRFKWNLAGNDGGDFSAALLPYASLPTTDGGAFDLGLAVPVGFALPADFDLGVMAAMESFTTKDLALMATVGHDLTGDFSGYVELYNLMPEMKTDAAVTTLDLGVNYALSKDVNFDAGVNFGLTEAATDLEAFLGATVRF